MSCYDSKNFCEDLWRHQYAEGEDLELVMMVSHPESEKFLMSWVNGDVEVLHVESWEGDGIINTGDTIWILTCLIEVLSIQRSRMGCHLCPSSE